MKIVSDFNFNLDKERVFKAIDCYKNSTIYDDVCIIYDELNAGLKNLVKPKGFYRIVKNNEDEKCSHTVYCLLTLGNEISEVIKGKFEQNEYLKAYLLDNMTDLLLFELSNQFYKHIKDSADKIEIGLSSRYSPGEKDIPLEYSQDLLRHLDLPLDYNIKLTSGFMINPPKSMLYYYKADKTITSNMIDHDCTKCNNVNCKMRSV